jgi:bacteriocin-like protein
MSETTIGSELTLDELAQIQGGRGFFQTVVDAGKWVVKHADEIKKVYDGAKSVWNTIKGWF